jgi:dolichol-phosphate mannosyltransferase
MDTQGPIRCEGRNAVKTLIVIPTYNESQNIERIIRSIFSATGDTANAHILVVDDNSPDGTAAIVENLMCLDDKERLFLIVRDRKRGLGTAYIRGFQWGLGRGYRLIIEMDADFSHNPIYLPGMIQEADHYDGIVGSRYVAGGGVRGWGPLRKIISRGGSLYARLILGIPIHDLTGGFNLWKSDILERIDLTQIRSEGYAFQIELKYRAFKKGFRLLEFPIIFEDRRQGTSKMSKRIILEAIYRVWLLKMLK